MACPIPNLCPISCGKAPRKCNRHATALTALVNLEDLRKSGHQPSADRIAAAFQNGKAVGRTPKRDSNELKSLEKMNLRVVSVVSGRARGPPEEQMGHKIVTSFDYKRAWPPRPGGEHPSQGQAEWFQHFDEKSPSGPGRSARARVYRGRN